MVERRSFLNSIILQPNIFENHYLNTALFKKNKEIYSFNGNSSTSNNNLPYYVVNLLNYTNTTWLLKNISYSVIKMTMKYEGNK